MHYRKLGKTGLEISEIGYGAWGIGKSNWIGADDRESLTALNKAIDLGLNFIDTALAYGEGHSERLVGQVVRNRNKQIYIATKVPPKNSQWPARGGVPSNEVFPGDYVIRSAEQSLRNLGVDAVDILQFHVWQDAWVGEGDWWEAVSRLKSQGKIRHFGISINDHQPENALRLIETGLVDTVQVIYNIFDQSPEDQLLSTCQKHDIGVIVRVPFDEGALTGRITPASTFPDNDFRNHYFGGKRKQEVDQHVQEIVRDLGISVDQLPAIALRYTLSDPAVSTVIPGMRSIRNVESNIGAAEQGSLTAEQLQKLKQHRWIRNFYA